MPVSICWKNKATTPVPQLRLRHLHHSADGDILDCTFSFVKQKTSPRRVLRIYMPVSEFSCFVFYVISLIAFFHLRILGAILRWVCIFLMGAGWERDIPQTHRAPWELDTGGGTERGARRWRCGRHRVYMYCCLGVPIPRCTDLFAIASFLVLGAE
jgi:hypothetical protein